MSARELPKIGIGGTDFFFDMRLGEFREVANPFNRINLDLLHETLNGFALIYDPQTHNVFAGDESAYKARNDLVTVELPTLELMDPVGFKQLVNQWKEDNPMLTAMIQNIPVVRENRTCTIGELLQEHKQRLPLLDKKERHHSKGKRL